MSKCATSTTDGCVLISFARKYLGVVAGLMGWLLIASGVVQSVPRTVISALPEVAQLQFVEADSSEGPRLHAAASAFEEDDGLLSEESEEAGGDGDDAEQASDAWRGGGDHWLYFATSLCLEHEHNAVRGSDEGLPRVWHARALGARGPPIHV